MGEIPKALINYKISLELQVFDIKYIKSCPVKAKGTKTPSINTHHDLGKHKERRKTGMVGNFSSLVGVIKQQLRPLSRGDRRSTRKRSWSPIFLFLTSV